MKLVKKIDRFLLIVGIVEIMMAILWAFNFIQLDKWYLVASLILLGFNTILKSVELIYEY